MVAYTTATNVREILIGVNTTVLSDIAVATFITRAENFINAKICGRYALPFTIVPPLVKTICEDISAFLIIRTLFTRDSVNKSDWIETYRDAMKILDEIRDGKTNLIDASGVDIPLVGGGTMSSNNSGYQPVFDIDDPKYWDIDSHLLDAVSDSRSEASQ